MATTVDIASAEEASYWRSDVQLDPALLQRPKATPNAMLQPLAYLFSPELPYAAHTQENTPVVAPVVAPKPALSAPKPATTSLLLPKTTDKPALKGNVTLQVAKPVVVAPVATVDHKTPTVAIKPVQTVTAHNVLGTKTGYASWYGPGFHGRRAANGSVFNMNALTAAHRTLPFGTHVRVMNPINGKACVVTITDRGPYCGARMIDLSKAAAMAIGMLGAGTAKVSLQILSQQIAY
jgi:rare lipoprotein A